MRLPAVWMMTLCAAALAAGGGLRAGEKGKGKAMTLKVGDKAPSFAAIDDQGKPWKSSEHVGKKVVVLYFFPADFTGGCTAQACGFRDNLATLKAKDVEVVGVSGDTPQTHEMFKKAQHLPFTLLADEKGELAKQFGVPVKVGKAGPAKGVNDKGEKVDVFRSATIQRYTVVIDKSGTIAAIDPITNAGGDAKRVAEIVEKFEKK